MKKTATICVAILSLSALTPIAFAATTGAYTGFGLGASKQDTPNRFIDGPNNAMLNQSRDIGGLGGRLFAGYRFNPYFGVEGGLAGYAQSKYNVHLNYAGMNLANASMKYSMATLDVVGKAYLPIADSGVSLYGLGGAALVHSKMEGKFNSVIPTEDNISSMSKTQNKIRPIAGVGVSYDIPQTQLTTSLEYSHLFGKGDVKRSDSAIPSAEMLTLNLAYNFG